MAQAMVKPGILYPLAGRENHGSTGINTPILKNYLACSVDT
jgi:hypothetical protein